MTSSDLHTDRCLFKQISAGDEKAFRTIFDLYKVDLYRIVIRITKSQVIAEEIIQELFTGLWVSREHLARVEEPASYIYRILLNNISKYLKKEAHQALVIRAATLDGQSSSNATEQLVDAHETQRLIEQALCKMPQHQKIVYRLSRQQGLTNFEIANQLHVSTNTVKTHLSKAIWFIRSYLRTL